MTRRDIEAVIVKVPRLTKFGVGVYTYSKPDGLTWDGYFRAEQAELLESAAVCTRVCEWLADIAPTKTVNRRRGSYGLKHMAERDIGDYVSNGSFIAAAIHCGFPYRLKPDSPNVWFGMSEKSLKAKDRKPGVTA